MCVRLTFPVKIPVIRQRDTQDVFPLCEEDPGAKIPMLHPATPCLHPARPACVSHTFPPDAEGYVCVCEVRNSLCPLSIYHWPYPTWTHTVDVFCVDGKIEFSDIMS